MRYSNVTIVRLPEHGEFIAYNDIVTDYLRYHTKLQAIQEILDIWPDLFDRKYLQGKPKYVLAVILRQI